MREAGSGSAGISFSLSLPRASLTARRHKSIRGSGSAGKRETQDVNIPSHKLHIHLVCSRNPPEKIEQEKWMPGLVTKPKPFSIHKSAASAQIHGQDTTFLWKLLKKLCVKEERLKSQKMFLPFNNIEVRTRLLAYASRCTIQKPLEEVY